MHSCWRSLAVSALIMVVLLSASCPGAAGTDAETTRGKVLSVLDYGAKGDGTTDDTGAFQKALDQAGAGAMGATVFVPQGSYLIEGHVTLPANVTLEGIWNIPAAWSQGKGSTLLAVEGEGNADGPPFITLGLNATIKGMTIFHPRQTTNPPKAYPWTIAGGGADNASIIDVLLVNPYQGVDFGTQASGRHYIRNLYGMPLRKGLFIDQCYDVGRVENVHFWPFWNGGSQEGSAKLAEYINKYGECFIFGRTDWQYVTNTFCWGYNIGYRFLETKSGSCNGNFLGIGADATNIAVKVDQCAPYGLLITNGEFVSFLDPDPVAVDIGSSCTGVVQFQNCAFWGPMHRVAKMRGSGTLTMNACNFFEWDPKGAGLPAISAEAGNLIVSACNFMKGGQHVDLGPGVESAVIMGNRFAGVMGISNRSEGSVEIGLNAARKPAKEEAGAIVVDDMDKSPAFQLEGEWHPATTPSDYRGQARWSARGSGNARVTWKPDLPKAGNYAVYVWYGADPRNDHATNALFEVRSAGATNQVRVNLKQNTGRWNLLGEYRFAKGRSGAVVLSNDADGNVIADAVKFVRKDK
jgi:hypothetical protein